MIERIKRWWRGLPAEDEMDEIKEMDKKAEEVLAQSTELADARALIKESRHKNAQADTKIADYQKRIKDENERRIAYMKGERP